MKTYKPMENKEQKRKKVQVIEVSDDNKKQLKILKAELNNKTFDETISYLFHELNKVPTGFQ